jgi:hypothetical protein
MRIALGILYTGLLISLVLIFIPVRLLAAPSPIERDVEGNWFINSSARFPSSGITLEIRRFALFHDDTNSAVPRLNKMSYAPGIDGLFVVNSGQFGDATSEGKLYHVSPDGSSITELLDVSDVFTLKRDENDFNQQGGLRSATFHPQFSQTGTPGYGKLYTTQSVLRPANTTGLNYLGPMTSFRGSSNNTTPGNIVDGSVVEWTATFDDSGNISSIPTKSARELYRFHTPDRQHPIKEAAFNPYAISDDPDYGLLYVLHPDGQNSYDVGGSAGTGQVGSDLLGKVVRINPLDPDGAGSATYSVPDSNPFVGADGQAPGGRNMLDEVFALGFRDPHTISFSKAGDMFISDIGANRVEEINLVQSGENHGWQPSEGTFFFAPGGGVTDLPAGIDPYTYPVAQYGHSGSGAHAIAGGYVIENGGPLDGQMLLGDFASSLAPLMIVSLADMQAAITDGDNSLLAPASIQTVNLVFDDDDDPFTPSIPKTSMLDILNDEPTYDGSGRTDIRFGQGPRGEIYILNKRNGWVYTVSASPPFGDLNGDGIINSDDWMQFQQGQGTDMTNLTPRQAYAQGDMDRDFDNDVVDFRLFKEAYAKEQR